MTENIDYWLAGSKDDLDTAEKLFAAKKYHHCLFFVHLSLEKILKAIFVYKKQGPPPPIHDLARLAWKSGLEPSQSLNLELIEISTFNVAARYDDYKFKFYKKATLEYATKWLKIGKKLSELFRKEIENERGD